ncbi:MAG: glycosyltransferase [Bacilli bacterium]|nr:glycosyltransferase [Bacilli bacterium]
MLKDYGNKKQRRESALTRFLFFGNIIPYKRLDILLDAINNLVEEGIDNFKVSICGYCRPEIWESKYAPIIKYPKYIECDIRRIPNELVGTYFCQNDYFVMPYQDIAQSGAMTVALNYNMPIIASDLDTFKEFITHKENGFLFKQGDVMALTDAMKWAIGNSSDEYFKLKDNLYKMVDENLSSNIIEKRYSDYLNSCLNA